MVRSKIRARMAAVINTEMEDVAGCNGSLMNNLTAWQ